MGAESVGGEEVGRKGAKIRQEITVHVPEDYMHFRERDSRHREFASPSSTERVADLDCEAAAGASDAEAADLDCLDDLLVIDEQPAARDSEDGQALNVQEVRELVSLVCHRLQLSTSQVLSVLADMHATANI